MLDDLKVLLWKDQSMLLLEPVSVWDILEEKLHAALYIKHFQLHKEFVLLCDEVH